MYPETNRPSTVWPWYGGIWHVHGSPRVLGLEVAATPPPSPGRQTLDLKELPAVGFSASSRPRWETEGPMWEAKCGQKRLTCDGCVVLGRGRASPWLTHGASRTMQTTGGIASASEAVGSSTRPERAWSVFHADQACTHRCAIVTLVQLGGSDQTEARRRASMSRCGVEGSQQSGFHGGARLEHVSQCRVNGRFDVRWYSQ